MTSDTEAEVNPEQNNNTAQVEEKNVDTLELGSDHDVLGTESATVANKVECSFTASHL